MRQVTKASKPFKDRGLRAKRLDRFRTVPSNSLDRRGTSVRWPLLVTLIGVFVLKLVVVWQLREHPLLQPDAGLDTTAYARLLGKKLERAGDVPVEGGTTPSPTTPDQVTRAQRQLTALQWVIPVLTGAVLVVNARMGEQQRLAQVSKGLVQRLLPGR